MAFLDVFADHITQRKIYGKSDSRASELLLAQYCLSKMERGEDYYEVLGKYTERNLGLSVEIELNNIARGVNVNPLFANTFRNLLDTPANYGSPGEAVIVNDGGIGLDFVDLSGTIGNPVLSQNLDPLYTVGGITPDTPTFLAGTPIEDVMREGLAKYIVPTLTDFTLDREGIYEAGTTIEVKTSNASWSMDSDGDAPKSLSVYDFANVRVGSFRPTPTSTHMELDFVNSTVHSTTPKTLSWKLKGRGDKFEETNEIFSSISWKYKMGFGVSEKIVSNDSTAQEVYDALRVKVLEDDRVGTYICTAENDSGENYTYFIYPTTFGVLRDIKLNGAESILGAFSSLGIFRINNEQNVSILVYAYKTHSTKAFAAGSRLNTN